MRNSNILECTIRMQHKHSGLHLLRGGSLAGVFAIRGNFATKSHQNIVLFGSHQKTCLQELCGAGSGVLLTLTIFFSTNFAKACSLW